MIDRNNLQTNISTSSIVKTNCEKVTNTELQNYFFGTFQCAKSLTANLASDIPIFAFSTSIPHYQRSVRTDIVHMSDQDSSATVTIKPDDQSQVVVQMNTSQTRLQIDCTTNITKGGVEGDTDQFYRGSWVYSKQSSNNVKVAFDSSCPSISIGAKMSQFRVSGIQINISTCHPSCQSCNGPLNSNCLTCATNGGASGPVNGQCTCLDSQNVFSNGICVNTCDSSNFYFKYNSICIYLSNCLQNIEDQCIQCEPSYFLADGLCLSSCPAAYVLIGQNCKYQKANIQGGTRYIQGLWRNDFSMISINKLGISMANYLKYNSNTSIYSRCGNINYLGGFFINQANSVINFPSIQNQNKIINVTFKYILVDYTDSGNSNIFVQLTVGSNILKKEIITNNSNQLNLCGFSSTDQVGIYSDNFDIPTPGDILITIINTNSKCKTGSGQTVNAHSYFGIREIDVFGFDCPFDYCLVCTSSSCTTCIDGYYWNGSICTQCTETCATCNNVTQCLTCKIGFILNSSSQCVCNDGFYLSDNICLACTNSACKTCNSSNPSQCTSCFSSKVLSQTGQCQDSCPPSQYPDNNSQCQNCQNLTCLTCSSTNSLQCLSCSSPSFLTNNTCQQTCPDKQYEDTLTRQCIDCTNINCKKCNPPTDNKCLLCNDPLLLQAGSCIITCGDGYYKDPNSNTCNPCSSSCKSCTPSLPTYCLSCYSPLVLNNGVCTNSCGKGQFLNAGGSTCENCMNTSCYTCQFPNTSLCTLCDANQYLENDNCVNDCSPGYYKSLSDNKCKVCPDSNCLQCDQNTPTYCYKCKNPTALLGSVCVSDCGIGKYNNSSNQICTDCPAASNCRTCKASNPNQCLSCQIPLGLLGTQCVTDCGQGKFIDLFANCQSCANTNCQTCNSSNSNLCLTCGGTKAYYQQNCIDNCPDNYFKDTNKSICVQCSNSNCKNCDAPPSQNCFSCLPPKGLQGLECVVNCNDGYYIDTNQVCQLCNNIRCKSCDKSNSSICLQCDSSKALYQNDCIDSCPDLYYKHPITGKCELCSNPDCKSCDIDNPDQCLSCTAPLLFKNSACVNNCGDLYYELGQQCLSCDNQDCKTCDPINPSNCLTCFPPKQILQNTCVYKCSTSEVYDVNLGQCIPCDNSCLTCDPSNVQICLSCSPPLVLLETKCKSQCIDGMYIDTLQNKCIPCLNHTCSTCNPLNSNECYSCNTPKLLLDTTCVDNCGQNMFISSNNKCLSCLNPISVCKNCSEQAPSICLSCNPPLALSGSDCVLDCGIGKVINSTTNICESCNNSTCKSCNFPNKNECITCDPPLVLNPLSISCENKCPDNMFFNTLTNICLQCTNNQCKTCLELSPNQCLSCQPPLHLQGLNCVSQCIKGYYPNQISNKCQECTNQGNNCLTCSINDPSKCSSCESPNALLNGNCVSSCDKGQVINTDNQTCINCQNTNCLTCSYPDTTQCLTCPNSKILNIKDCVDKCPFNSSIDLVKNICGVCTNPNCEHCDTQNPYYCVSCKPPKVKKGVDCVDSCGDNMYVDINDNQCKTCNNTNNNCLKCQNPPNSNLCISCFDPFALLNGNCVSNCGGGKVKNPSTKICEDCTNTNCLTCSLQNKNLCLTCPSNLFLKNGNCVQNCGDFQFEENQVCKDCQDQTCKSCNPNSFDCTACQPPKVLLLNKCVDDCGDGWYKTLNDNSCKQCSNQLCKICDQEESSICLSCQPPKVLIGKNCGDSCGEDKYLNSKTNVCQSCSPKCKKCTNNKECSECYQGYFNLSGYCVQYCPKESFFENKILYKCELCTDPNCINCFQNANICQKCKQGFSISPLQQSNNQKCEKCQTHDCNLKEKDSDNPAQYTSELTQKALSSIISIVTLLVVSLSPFYTLVSLFDLLQVMNYLVFINVNYSSGLYSFLQLFNFANFEFIPNLKNNNSQAPYKFKQENFDTFLYCNLIQSIVIWVASAVLYLISKAIKPSGVNTISYMIKSYRDNYKYNIVIGIGFLTYCDIVLSVFLQLYDIDKVQTYHIVGIVGSILFIIPFIGLNFLVYKVATQYIFIKRFEKKVSFLYDGLQRKKSFMNLIFLLRKTLIIYLLVFKQEAPIFQSLQILLVLGVESTIILVIKPYKSKIEMNINFLGRLLLLMSLIFIVVMSLDDQISNQGEFIRTIQETLVIISLSSLYISQITFIIYQFLNNKFRRSLFSLNSQQIKVI